MKFLLPLCILLVFLLAQCLAVELITNGDFEQPLTTHWEQITSGPNTIINRATHYDPDPDYEVYVYKGIGSGYARLYQTVNIPSTDLDFTVHAKSYVYASSSAWAGAAVVISYLDELGFLLGETYICARTTYCPWTNNPTFHIIDISDSLWHNYGFNINDELSHLSGVNPLDINQIQISLFDEIYHC